MQVQPTSSADFRLHGIGKLSAEQIIRRQQISERQPGWYHNEPRTFLQMFCCCCGRNGRQPLTNHELQRFEEFQNTFVHDYSEKNSDHEAALQSFFLHVFSDSERQNADDRMRSDIWQDIGFQRNDPRTDFRAGGLLSLLCLFYFARYQPNDFARIKGDSGDDFFIAISSINLTSRLMSYLHMNDNRMMPESH